MADHFGLEPEMLRVRIPPELLRYVLVEQRSARLPVTQEIVGSNPIEDARQIGTVRKPVKRRPTNARRRCPTFVIVCEFDSHSCHLNNMRRLGIGKPKWL